jgi:NAD(P)-dependent dehydrogenase (short-subunit alcohol dehydrogenase family)
VTPTSPLAGKSVFVTGGARRLGRAIALTLAQAGADVAISYRSSEAEALETTAAIAALGRRSLAVPCDVRSETSVRAAVAQVVAGFGQLDILVNNAAVFASAALESLSLDQWDTVFETNARGPFLVAREALPHLRTARGRIINMGSLGGLHAWAGHAHYCASKAALHMLTQAIAKAFAPDVSVNCVAPGWIALQDGPQNAAEESGGNKIPKALGPSSTEDVAPSFPALFAGRVVSQAESAGASTPAAPSFFQPIPNRAELQAARFAAKTPMGRNGNSDDVAQAVLFFSTGPHFITGQTLVVDGGLGLS